ncbi:HopJ type III effector protein [Marinobacterium sp. YM272]|uniref:HopJ type III effector protein n=1 Tax=Marinobacterium sp. YM272 TaxID=3421654 RepID=UPI003D7F27C9
MRFLILGAGGIGCYYGARLIAAGHQCTFVARGEHLKALQNRGLEVRHPEFRFSAKVDATDIQGLIKGYGAADFDLALISLKGGATATIINALAPWLVDGSMPLLSLQNGVDNELLIAENVGAARTIGGLAVRIGGHILEPGVIDATGPAQIIMGSWPKSADHSDTQVFVSKMARLFNDADIPTQVSEDIRYELWRKLLINNGVNPLSALTGLDTRTLTSDPVLGPTILSLMKETASVAAIDDVELTDRDVDEMFDLISRFDAIKTSMLVDREKGRPLELDGISGAVLSRAARLGIDTPLTALIHRLLEMNIASPTLFSTIKKDEPMTPEQLIDALENNQPVEFEDSMAVIDEHFDYTPAAFTNGEQQNDAGQNAGSCKILAFGQLMNLSEEQTLRCFGRFYQDVLNTPEGSDHGNIRNFMKSGWNGVTFASTPLQRR